jgi:hypothetical protein
MPMVPNGTQPSGLIHYDRKNFCDTGFDIKKIQTTFVAETRRQFVKKVEHLCPNVMKLTFSFTEACGK